MLKLFTLAQSHAASLWLRREEGQTMAEYGVILAVITIGIVAVLGLLSGAIQGALGRVVTVVSGSGA